MDPDYELTQGDADIAMTATLLGADGTSTNLSSATSIAFHLAIIGGGAVSPAGVVSIVNAAAGQVQYLWAVGDTVNACYLSGEFQVTFPGGKIVSYPTDPKLLIRINAQIG